MVNHRILAGLSIVIGLVGLIFLSLLYALTGGDVPFDHGVIMDAGSSHTEAILYEWKGDKYQGTGYVTQKHSCNVDDGISSFPNPEDAGESLRDCLQEVAEKIPEDKRKDTPVYLAATAGMRIQNISNPYLNLATFTAVKCSIDKSPMTRAEVGIISGQSEGIFAWITSNFVLGLLQGHVHPTIGSMDMGGASTQISFEVDEKYQNNSEVQTLRLYGENYHVYSVSYLCYGAAEIYRRYLASIVPDPETKAVLTSPCHHNGWKESFNADYLFNEPCTETKKLKEWIYFNSHKLNYTYTFEGGFDSQACKARMMDIFNPEICSQTYKDCFQPIDPVTMPEKFMAFSSFFYTAEFVKAEKNTSLAEYREKVEGFCKQNWKDVDKVPYPKPTKKTLPRFCLQGYAVDIILTFGYNFNDSTWESITFTKEIEGKSVGWALGFMINATNAIPEEGVEPAAISTVVFIILIIICCLLLVLGFFFCVRSKNQKRFSRPGA